MDIDVNHVINDLKAEIGRLAGEVAMLRSINSYMEAQIRLMKESEGQNDGA